MQRFLIVTNTGDGLTFQPVEGDAAAQALADLRNGRSFIALARGQSLVLCTEHDDVVLEAA